MSDIVRDIMKLCNPEDLEAANATDTSAEAVKQLIAGANGIPAFAAHNDTLRALLAERDRLWEALKLAEDVLSRPPWSNNMLADGRHPNGVISEIRNALKKVGHE